MYMFGLNKSLDRNRLFIEIETIVKFKPKTMLSRDTKINAMTRRE